METEKNNDVIVSSQWTRGELAGCIAECGGIPDESTVASLAEVLRSRLQGILQELTSEIEMAPAKEPAASLCRIGVSLPSCDNCAHYEDGICGHYYERRNRDSWELALDCGHYLSSLPRGTCCRKLRYTDKKSGHYGEFPLEIISLQPGKDFPDALKVVKALRKSPEWSEKLDEVWVDVDGTENPRKWELVP